MLLTSSEQRARPLNTELFSRDMDTNPKRILVVRNAALGDVLLATAVLPVLSLRYPGRSIDFATSFPSVLEGNPYVSQVISASGPRSAAYEEVFDLDMSYEMRPSQSILSAFAGSVGCSESDLSLSYTVSEGARAAAAELLSGMRLSSGNFVAVQAGSSFWLKNWPIASFETLVRRLREVYDTDFLLLGSADDPGVEGTVDLRGSCSLEVSVAVLERCIAYVGLDSSLLHFAKALGKPVAAFFGHSDPSLRIQIGERDCLLVSRIPCRFCHHRQRPPVVLPVCIRQALWLRILDTILNLAFQRHFGQHDPLSLRVALLVLPLLKWREKGRRIAPCMGDISVDRAFAQLSPWLGDLGVPRRVPPTGWLGVVHA